MIIEMLLTLVFFGILWVCMKVSQRRTKTLDSRTGTDCFVVYLPLHIIVTVTLLIVALVCYLIFTDNMTIDCKTAVVLLMVLAEISFLSLSYIVQITVSGDTITYRGRFYRKVTKRFSDIRKVKYTPARSKGNRKQGSGSVQFNFDEPGTVFASSWMVGYSKLLQRLQDEYVPAKD